jgi:hypothetical protein
MREAVPVCDVPGAIPHSRARDGRVWRAADAVDAVAERYALALGDDPATTAALLRSLCAEPDPAPDAPSAPAAPLARQGAAATALHVDDPELVRVRGLLADLRPDAADPWAPMAAPVETTPAGAMPCDPSANWGGVPRGLFGGAGPAAEEASRRCAAEVLAELAELPADAAAVLRWLRERATLGAGLRGLYADVGLAFASEDQAAAWGDLGARREGAPAWGRRLVLRAAEAWGR